MKRDGIEIPEDIATQPILPSNLIGYLDAFYDLDTERSHGQHGLTRIPWSKITRYGEFYRYDLDELHFFIRRMDDALLEDMAKGGKGGGSAGAGETVQRPPRPD
jgi:hypothetical protein